MELTTTISEWVKVLLVLFQMRESAKLGTVTSEFIEKYILERTGEQNSVFALGETLIYDQIRTFSQIRASKSVQINYTKAHVPESHKREEFVACGEAECDAKGHIHSAAKCWVKHPERRPPHLKNADKTGTPSTTKTKNDSTSGKKEKFRRGRFKGKRGDRKVEESKPKSSEERSKRHKNLALHMIKTFGLSQREINNLEEHGRLEEGANESHCDESEGSDTEYPDLGDVSE